MTFPTGMRQRKPVKISQLYNMANDRKETNNLVKQKPDLAADLTKLFTTAAASGRATPGVKQKSDATVVIWKNAPRIPSGD